MTHRIRRQILDLELPREAGAVALQRQAGRVFQEKVLPRLDEVFSKIAPADRIIRIDRLEIDLGALGETNWERSFVERCVEQISRQVTEAAAKADTVMDEYARVLNPEENALAVFRFFLETGALPWYARGMALKTLETYIMQAAAERPAALQQALLSALQRNDSALRRLLWQFSPDFSDKMLDIALGFSDGWLTQAVQMLQSRLGRQMDTVQRVQLFKTLLAEAINGGFSQPPQAELLTQLYYRVLSQTAPANETTGKRQPAPETAAPDTQPKPADAPEQTPAQEKRDKTSFPPEGIMVDNAGVVLLGVYLPAFFQELKMTDGKTFPTPDDQYRAIHLLHFLATGLENPEEPALTLPKLLCGLPLEEPVPLELALSEAEKNESNDLLKAAIQNWPALKNTSPDGLRSGFLQRMGHLSRAESQSAWLLRPERLGQDMLLERLPWSISVIKLPWMEEAIQVEW
ncbi:MAG: hypothetical protein L6Q97_08375 [Thermoanaerobaculia bacterium]|nr:hypothetical protein [Thermoanaerobaculia bacterium]